MTLRFTAPKARTFTFAIGLASLAAAFGLFYLFSASVATQRRVTSDLLKYSFLPFYDVQFSGTVSSGAPLLLGADWDASLEAAKADNLLLRHFDVDWCSAPRAFQYHRNVFLPPGFGLGDDGFRGVCAIVRELPSVDILDISEAGVTDQGLLALATAPNVKLVFAKGTPITARGIEELKKTNPWIDVVVDRDLWSLCR
jgi:hypothetical protein